MRLLSVLMTTRSRPHKRPAEPASPVDRAEPTGGFDQPVAETEIPDRLAHSYEQIAALDELGGPPPRSLLQQESVSDLDSAPSVASSTAQRLVWDKQAFEQQTDFYVNKTFGGQKQVARKSIVVIDDAFQAYEDNLDPGQNVALLGALLTACDDYLEGKILLFRRHFRNSIGGWSRKSPREWKSGPATRASGLLCTALCPEQEEPRGMLSSRHLTP